MYKTSAFENGLRLVTVSMPHAYSISMGLYIPVGSRYEQAELAGVSHFIEHMLFKGTPRRPTPREIALAIEGVGGDINASTGREMTTYYARVSRYDLSIAADVLVDMLRNSRFQPSDVERERQVIIEEINESLDAPDELVFMQFQEMLWPNHPLGRDIAGTRESVRGITREGLLNYMAQGYSPKHSVISIAGAVTHEKVRDLIGPMLADWRGGNGLHAEPVQPFNGPITRVLHRPIEQCHLLLGLRSLGRTDEERFALSLLNIILGTGMSSRLFVEIREQMGLAYSVYCYTNLMSETGSFAIYAGVDSNNLKACIEAILDQLHRLRTKFVSHEELAMAKAYARGRTLLRLEDTGANASWVGNQLALVGAIQTPEQILDRIDEVTQEEIQRVACRLFRDDALTLSLVGPIKEMSDGQNLLKVE